MIHQQTALMNEPPQSGARFFEKGIRIAAGVTVQRSPETLYRVWHDFTDIPRFVDALQEVTYLSPTVTKWVVNGPRGSFYSWTAAIINDEPNRLIAWRSGIDAAVENAGSISFRQLPYYRGTEVRAVVEYVPPLGAVGNAMVASSENSPSRMLHMAMFRFRQLMETGELATALGQPAGSNSARSDRPGEEARKVDPNVQDIARVEETQ